MISAHKNSPSFRRSLSTALLAAMVAALGSTFITTSAQAANASWNLNADGSWATDANWNPAAAPGSTSSTTSTDIATFGTIINAARIITVDTNRDIFGIDFAGNSSSYTLSGGSLILSNGGYIQTSGAGTAHTDTISSNILLSGNASFNTSSTTVARILAITGTVTGSATTGNTSILTLGGAGNTTSNSVGGISDGANGGNLAIVKNDAGTWVLSSTGNTFTGGITVNAGTLRTGGNGNTTTLFGAGTITLAGGTLNLGSTSSTTVNNALVVNGVSGVSYRGNGNFNPTSLTGTGTLTLSNTNGTGTLTITPNSFQNFAGTVNVTANSNLTILRLSATFDQSSLQNATLNLNANTQVTQQATTNVGSITVSIGALSGTAGSIGSAGAASGTYTYVIGGNNASTSFGGTIVNGANSTTALRKAGSGTLTLSGINTYTGLTTVTTGTLATGASEVIADASALKLAGGSLAIGATFTETLGTLDLDAASSITLGSGAKLLFGNSSALDWTGGSVSITGAFTDGSSIRFGTDNTGLTSAQLALISINGQFAAIDSSGYLTASAVPEPTTYAAIAGVAGLAFAAYRRRRLAA